MKKFLLYIFACIALVFASCTNITSDNDGIEKKSNFAKISGSVSAGGAFPEEYADFLNAALTASPSRSAFPSISGAEFIYSIEAVNVADSTDRHTAVIADDKKSYTITIPSEQAKTYKLKAGVKLSATGPDILSDESDEFEISPENMIVAKNITLKFSNSPTDKGNISLKVTVPDSILSASMKYGTTTMQGTKSGSEFTFSKTNLSPGTYQATFNFYSKASQQGELLYSFEETVNVYGNMTTNTWFQNGNSPWLKTIKTDDSITTTCEITKIMETDFKQTKIYVDTTASSSEENGTSINPCKTFSAALAKLTDSTRDYTILVRGNITGNLEISGTPAAKSIKIRGANGLDASGEPQDSLDGNQAGTVLKISTQVPVILQNIEIKNGKTSQKGNGIFNSGKLTLLSGTFIRNNKSVGTGGGIYNQGEVYMLGGIISDNDAVMGGGIYNADVGKLEIKGGEISGNNSSDGAGLYLTNNSTGYTQISGGKISSNSVESKGAAIYVDTGSVLKMKGDFYIPYDSEKKNDIYVASSSSIKISGNLTPPQECTDEIMATLTLKSDLYSSTSAVISLDTSPSPTTTIAEEYYKFKITPNSGNNYGLSGEGKSKTIIGTKAKANAVGDIVFNDGSAVSKDETLTDAQKSKSIAVIFYKGTGLNNGSDITTVRTLGYGVTFEGNSGNGYKWCSSESAAGYRRTISAIQWDPNNSLKSHNNYDDYNGSDNFAEFAKVVNDTGTAGNYPIFEFANNYKSKLGSRLNGGISDYETGWFVPTVGELYQLLLKTSSIYTSISKCGGTAPITNNGVHYWTSNSYDSNSTGLKFTSSDGYDPFHNGRGAGESQYFESKYFVCAIHEF